MRTRLRHDVAPNVPCGGKARLTGLMGLADFVAVADPELAANAMLCAIHQATWLLGRQIASQGREFEKNGGFRERLYALRFKSRSAQASGESESPQCPECDQPMVLRVARQGTHAGAEFWGCSAYPQCRAIRPISSSAEPAH